MNELYYIHSYFNTQFIGCQSFVLSILKKTQNFDLPKQKQANTVSACFCLNEYLRIFHSVSFSQNRCRYNFSAFLILYTSYHTYNLCLWFSVFIDVSNFKVCAFPLAQSLIFLICDLNPTPVESITRKNNNNAILPNTYFIVFRITALLSTS